MNDDREKTPNPTLEPDSFELHVSPQTVQLGQPFSVSLSLRHPHSLRFELLIPPANTNFDILSKTRNREDFPKDSSTTFSIQMAAFELGTLELPPLQFEVTSPSQVASFSPPTPSISVVASTSHIPSQLEDVRPPSPVFIPSYTPLYAGTAALAMALALLLSWKWLNHRKKMPPPPAPAQPLAAKTKEALLALRAQALPSQGKIREYYFKLSEIIRGYVGQLYHFDALECTTTEFIRSIQRLYSTQLPFAALASFLHESDFIKYAKGTADIAKCELDFKFAYQLVEQTTPTDTPPPAHSNPHAHPPLP
ncbi:MAG: BatD family protein [Proteobacteria bacterium]|nr:BatD family protein [Cystobacterineae bacterium]MCL2313909.1 BatD family protein [Pseudomonadota bacterium]